MIPADGRPARWMPVGLLMGLVATLGAAAGPMPSQDGTAIELPPEVDPHTRGEAALLERVGVLSLGPFPWGDAHASQDVSAVFGGIPILWAESAHFRIGSSLAEYELADDKQERARIRAELKRLGEDLPRVDARGRRLGPWLRLHLYTRRMEQLYESFCEDFDLDGSEPMRFIVPVSADAPDAPGARPRAKYCLLVSERKSSFARYAGRYLNTTGEVPWRHHFHETGALLYATSQEFLTGSFDHDSALYCAVVHAIVQNLLFGLAGSGHELPLWWRVGLAHYYSRRIDERWNSFIGDPAAMGIDLRQWNWEPKVHGRAKHRAYASTAEMFAWQDADQLDLADNMIAWSRVDFLMSHGPKQAGKFLRGLIAPFEGEDPPTAEQWVERQQTSMKKALGLDPEGFDRAWRAWVSRNYEDK